MQTRREHLGRARADRGDLGPGEAIDGDAPTARLRSNRFVQPSGRLTLGCVCVILLGLLILPQQIRHDDAVRVVMLRQFVDGIKPVTQYSFIQPLVSVPPYWVLNKLGFGVYAVTLLPLAWMAWWAWAVRRILARERSAAFAHHAVVLTMVSLLLAYIVGFNSDSFTALGVSGGLIGGLLGSTPAARWTGWIVLVVAAANTPTLAAAIALIALVLIVSRRQLRFAVLPAAVVALIVIECSVVTGHLSFTRYAMNDGGEQPMLPWGRVTGFGWPLWSGLLAILFSFGRGLLFFIPQLWNGPTRSSPLRTSDRVVRVEHLLWFGAAALVPVYAKWWAWWGGVSFGPRFFMLAVVPAAFAGAAVICDPNRGLFRSGVVLGATLASAWVAFAGAVFDVTTRAFNECVSGGTFERDVLCLYTPEYSGIWAPIWTGTPVGQRHVVFGALVLLALVPTLGTIVIGAKQPAIDRSSAAARHLRGRWSI